MKLAILMSLVFHIALFFIYPPVNFGLKAPPVEKMKLSWFGFISDEYFMRSGRDVQVSTTVTSADRFSANEDRQIHDLKEMDLDVEWDLLVKEGFARDLTSLLESVDEEDIYSELDEPEKETPPLIEDN